MRTIGLIMIILISSLLLQAQEQTTTSYNQDTIWLKPGLIMPCTIIEDSSDSEFIFVNFVNDIGQIKQTRYPWSQIKTAHMQSRPYFLHSITYKLELINGTTINGNLLSKTETQIKFQPKDNDILTINRDKIISLMPLKVSFAQFVNHKKTRAYKTWVSLNESPYKITGWLYAIEDSSILLSKQFNVHDKIIELSDFSNIYYHDIYKIRTRRKGKLGRSILIGTLTGFTIGLVYALAVGEDYNAGTNAMIVIAGGTFAIVGAGIGAIIGSVKVKIPINGSKDHFNRNKRKLENYSIK